MTRNGEISIALFLIAGSLLAFGIARVIKSEAANSQPAVQCFFPQEKDRLVQLAHEAVDNAYMEHVEKLYEIWVRDPADQPRRAMSGMAINLSAYHRARANIRVWDPPICQ